MSGDSVEIEIDSAPDFNPALTAIFADSLADLAPTLPSHWQVYAQAHLLPANQSGTLIAAPADSPGHLTEVRGRRERAKGPSIRRAITERSRSSTSL